jgi:hypothetical protein
MFKQVICNMLLAVVAICGVMGIIGCGEIDVLIIDLTDPEPIESEDNEWIGTWALESYMGLSLLETLAEYDDYDDEDWTFSDVNGVAANGDLLEQAIAAFWSGDGVTGYDGSITYTFSEAGVMEIAIVIRLDLTVRDTQGILVGKDQIPGTYSLIGSTYATEIGDEVEMGTWNRMANTLTLHPDQADASTVLKKL